MKENDIFLRTHFTVIYCVFFFASSVHIWTIALDVIAGIMVMLWLWRISNADEYMIQLTLVSDVIFENIFVLENRLFLFDKI